MMFVSEFDEEGVSILSAQKAVKYKMAAVVIF